MRRLICLCDVHVWYRQVSGGYLPTARYLLDYRSHQEGEEMALLFFIWLQLKVHDYKQDVWLYRYFFHKTDLILCFLCAQEFLCNGRSNITYLRSLSLSLPQEVRIEISIQIK
jgi:hypothetical protein